MKPKIIKHLGNEQRCSLIECPECGLRAWIDREQYEGKVSIDCPECKYHETHNLIDVPLDNPWL